MAILLDLPPEIRLQIYSYLRKVKRHIYMGSPSLQRIIECKDETALFLVNKQIYREAKAVLGKSVDYEIRFGFPKESKIWHVLKALDIKLRCVFLLPISYARNIAFEFTFEVDPSRYDANTRLHSENGFSKDLSLDTRIIVRDMMRRFLPSFGDDWGFTTLIVPSSNQGLVPGISIPMTDGEGLLWNCWVKILVTDWKI